MLSNVMQQAIAIVINQYQTFSGLQTKLITQSLLFVAGGNFGNLITHTHTQEMITKHLVLTA